MRMNERGATFSQSDSCSDAGYRNMFEKIECMQAHLVIRRGSRGNVREEHEASMKGAGLAAIRQASTLEATRVLQRQAKAA